MPGDQTTKEGYRVSARAYWTRAVARLKDGTSEALFYAAFELRCGIEARMKEYLDARAEIARRKKHGYQIAKLARGLERVFASGEEILSLTFVDQERKPTLHLLFTPVRKGLRQAGKRLGDYMHAMEEYRRPEDAFWERTREFLSATADELGNATFGSLLGPPLEHRKTGETSMVVSSEPHGFKASDLGPLEVPVNILVRAWEDMPSREYLDDLTRNAPRGRVEPVQPDQT
jgi:hypothetical protein